MHPGGQEFEIQVEFRGEAPPDMPFGVSDLRYWGDDQNENSMGIFNKNKEQFDNQPFINPATFPLVPIENLFPSQAQPTTLPAMCVEKMTNTSRLSGLVAMTVPYGIMGKRSKREAVGQLHDY